MSSQTFKLKNIILGGCAVLAVSACSKVDSMDSFYSYNHPAENYYNREDPAAAEYAASSRVVQNNKYAKAAPQNKAVSKRSDVDVAFSEPAAAPSYSIAVEGETQPGKFIPEGEVPMAVNGQVTPVIAPAVKTLPNEFMLTGCPSFDIHHDMRSISFFKGSDTSKLVADAAIHEVRGTCTETPGQLEVDLKMLIDARIGAYGRYQTDPSAEELQSYPYFVALINKATGAVEYKKIFAAIVRFPAQTTAQSDYENINAVIPIPQGQSANAYALNIGFQLNSDQLNYNRSKISAVTPMAAMPSSAPAMMAPSMMEPSSPAPMGEMGSNNAYVVEAAPTSSSAINIEIEEPAGMTPLSAQAPAASSYTPTYQSSATSLSRDRRFLRGRPRVSQDPIADTYGDTQVQ